jgi:hypothetical protein
VQNLTSVFCSSSFCCSIWVASSSAVCVVIVSVSWEGIRGQSDGDGDRGSGTGALCSRGTVARCGLAAEGRVGEAVWDRWAGSDGYDRRTVERTVEIAEWQNGRLPLQS